ncbi:MAG: hypothetical protein QNJ14_10455 [Woeseiaceae bacterium]|nr:hypothetical protein [Woeseiaceae bacterium]
MTIEDVERELEFTFPLPHRRDIENADDRIHIACEYLLPDGPGRQDFLEANRYLRKESWQGWEKPYVAFASQGCGDWFAYDTSIIPYKIFYVDPTERVKDAAAKSGEGTLVLATYEAWKECTLQTYDEGSEDFDGW